MIWPEQRLGRLARLRVSNVDKLERDGEQPVQLCNYVDVYKNDSVTADLKFMRATATSSQIANFGLRVGDTVFTKDSETADDIGVPAYIAEAPADLVCGYHLAIATPDSRVVNPRFLYWAMASHRVREQWSVLAAGVTRVGLRSDDIGKALVPVPSLDEQRRIADFLDTETTRLDRLAALRVAQRRALMSRYRASLSKLYGSMPTPDFLEGRAGSVARPLRYLIARTIGGRTPEASVADDGAVPWLSIGDLSDGDTVTTGSRSFSITTLRGAGMEAAPAGAVVLAMYASLGKVSVLGAPAAFNQAIIGLVPRSRVPTEYLVGWLELAQPSLSALARTSTQPNLNAEQVRGLRFPVHDSAEMERIASSRSFLRTTLAGAEAAIDRAQSLVAERRQALITAAVTGQFDVSTAQGGAA